MHQVHVAPFHITPCALVETKPFTAMSSVRLLLWPLVFLALFSGSTGNLLRNLLRNNVAGPEINFQTVPCVFEPDAGIRKSVEYQALNGRFGNDAIERLGLGEDGKTEERRALQKYRDSIGALAYQAPGL